MKKKILWALVLIAIGIQFVPVDRSNPPIEGEIAAPPEVAQILERSCYDCHSHEVRWPWYGYVAPVSWLVAYDVEEAREHLNFSRWDQYEKEEQLELVEEIWEEVEDHEMPLDIYLWLHRDAVLSEVDRQTLRGWSTTFER